MAWSRKHKCDLPIYLVYGDVMEILDRKDANGNEDERAKKYREKIIGKTALSSSPQEYNDIGAVIEMGIDMASWKQYPIHDRAKILSRMYLKNMVSVIDAHYKEQDDQMEKRNKGNGSS